MNVRATWHTLRYVVRGAYVRLHRYDAGTRAAALAYYALLSLFPLLILLISLFSRWLTVSQAMRFVLILLGQVAPTVPAQVIVALQQVVAARGAVDWIATVALLWSASSLFTALAAAVDKLWSGETGRAFWEHRLLSFALVVVVVVLSVSASVVGFALSLLPQLLTLLWQVPPAVLGRTWQAVAALLMLAGDVVLYALLYRFVPSRTAPWPAVWVGAACAAVGWNLVKAAFGWYLARFARYGLVYGTLASLVAFLVWVYLSGLAVLIGAAVGAACADLAEEGSS